MSKRVILKMVMWVCVLGLGVSEVQAQKMYWTDTGADKIQRANLDGTDVEDVVTTGLSLAWGIAIDHKAQKLYWSDYNASEIWRADLDGSNSEMLIEICCPDSLVLDPDGGKMYWPFDFDFIGGVGRSNLDGSGVETIVPADSQSFTGIAFDPVEEKIYWVSQSEDWIIRSNADGSNLEMPLIEGIVNPAGIAIDHLERKIYWTSSTVGKILRANLDGTNIEDVLLTGPLWDIALDLREGKMYWTTGMIGKIFRADMNGTNTEELVTGLNNVSYIALDIPLATPTIPTVSQWGLAAMTLLLLCGGTFVIRRRTPPITLSKSTNHFFAASLLLVTITGNVLAQSEVIPSYPTTIIDLNVDSGVLSAADFGKDAAVIFSHDISLPGVPWMRIHFDQVKLSGSKKDGNQSFIRITSLEDGDQQILDANNLTWWGNSSGYFNGDEIRVELLAFPATGENRFVVDKVLVTDFGGDPGCVPTTLGICGSTDDRVSSNEPGTGRLRSPKNHSPDCGGEIVCTAFLINNQHCGFLTTGHCCKAIVFGCFLFKAIVEFNVPPSDLDGALNASLLVDQYPVDKTSLQKLNTGGGSPENDGEDWCYFGTYPARFGSTPKDAEGSTYTLANPVPAADGSTLRITGYGQDSDPLGTTDECNEYHHTKQTSTGPYTDLDGTIVRFQIDAQPGNSGSPVKHESSSEVYAIFTDGLCDNADNLGTAVDHPDLLAALANPQGLCGDCNNNWYSRLQRPGQ